MSTRLSMLLRSAFLGESVVVSLVVIVVFVAVNTDYAFDNPGNSTNITDSGEFPEWDASHFFSGDLDNGDFALGIFSRRDRSYYRKQNTKWLYDTTWRKEKYFEDSLVLELCAAMRNSDIPGMKKAIENGANVNARGKDDMPLLFWSMCLGEEVFEFLLSEGADPNFIVENQYHIEEKITGLSFFHLMVHMSGIEDERTPFFRHYASIMLKYGADPNYNNRDAFFLHGTPAWTKGLWGIMNDFGVDTQRFPTNRHPL